MTEIETLCNGKWLRLRRRGRWEFVERTNPAGGVAIVAVTDGGRLLLVEQHRAALDGPCIELPAGLVGDAAGAPDEDAVTAAHRELIEETGYRAASIEWLTAGPSSPGMSSEIIAFVRARGLVRLHAGGGDDSEDIRVHEIELPVVAAWLLARTRAGCAVDPKIYAALHFLEHEDALFTRPAD
jgi:ADP-ribose pyrophosphatase